MSVSTIKGSLPQQGAELGKSRGSSSPVWTKPTAKLSTELNWSTDTIIVNGRPFTIIFPEEE